MEKTTSTRSLRLPDDLDNKFNEIKFSRNFKKRFFHNAFHNFYGIAVAYGAMNVYKHNEKQISEEDKSKVIADLKDIQGKKGQGGIENKQLIHHDDLFKTISYWYRIKMKDDECYKVLLAIDDKTWKDNYDTRKICEKFFIEKWDEFRRKIGEIGTEFPDVLMYAQFLREMES